MPARLLIVAALAATLAVPSAQAAPVGPTGLRGFLLRPVKQMTWSTPQRLRLAKPRFASQDESVTTRPVKRSRAAAPRPGGAGS